MAVAVRTDISDTVSQPKQPELPSLHFGDDVVVPYEIQCAVRYILKTERQREHATTLLERREQRYFMLTTDLYSNS